MGTGPRTWGLIQKEISDIISHTTLMWTDYPFLYVSAIRAKCPVGHPLAQAPGVDFRDLHTAGTVWTAPGRVGTAWPSMYIIIINYKPLFACGYMGDCCYFRFPVVTSLRLTGEFKIKSDLSPVGICFKGEQFLVLYLLTLIKWPCPPNSKVVTAGLKHIFAE